MFVIGLTGSQGAGKSTVAAMFAAAGAAIFDADRAVHDLYRGAAAPQIAEAFPGVVEAGAVDRAKLSALVVGDNPALKKLEAIVHPLVREAQVQFRQAAAAAGRHLAVLEIPLLLETGGAARVDTVVLITAERQTRLARVLERAGMTKERFEGFEKRQMSQDDKRRWAHFIIDNGGSLAATRRQTDGILLSLAAAIAAR